MKAQKPSDPDEERLVKLYMELTGKPEACARAVYMHVTTPEEAPVAVPSALALNPASPLPEEDSKPAPQRPPQREVALALLLGVCVAAVFSARSAEVAGSSNSFVSRPLSLADAVNLALAQNPNVQRARKDLEATQGIAIQTRAIALPTVGVNGSYNAVERSDIDTIEVPGFSFGTPQNWSSQVKLVQNLYQGGRMLSAFRVSSLVKQQALLNYQTALADTVLNVQVGYYDVLLAAQQITVQEASVELLSRELTDTTRRFDAGTVPRFNVLRAEVELANARPRLINARHSLNIAKNNLANLLGFHVPRETSEDIPLALSGTLEAEPYEIELPRAVTLALERRTELGALRKARALREEDVVSAKAGYKPVLQGYVGYDFHNSMLSQDLGVYDKGWIAGVQLSWNIFDGLRTQGRIKEATANSERAAIDLDDAGRRIELEVRTAYSAFIEAREVMESQKKVHEEAEEALRLAQARAEAGTGTQLDVLSAQTALTQARTTEVQSLHDYATARARLQRAIGGNTPSEASGR